MTEPLPAPSEGVWKDWLLRGRYSDDPDWTRFVQDTVAGYAARILDNADLQPNKTLLDVGTGDGLVAFAAIERGGPTINVILSDISNTLLAHAEETAGTRGVRHQCTLLQCDANSPLALPSQSVDIVTSRACIAYIADKASTFREFERVLKPGGRLSIAEPVFRDEALSAAALRNVVADLPSEAPNRLISMMHRWKSAQFPDTLEEISRTPWLNYSERDLLGHVQAAGFVNIHLELRIDVGASPHQTWSTFLASRPLPWALSLAEVLAERFSEEERRYFEPLVRAGFEAGKYPTVDRIAYLWADKPKG